MKMKKYVAGHRERGADGLHLPGPVRHSATERTGAVLEERALPADRFVRGGHFRRRHHTRRHRGEREGPLTLPAQPPPPPPTPQKPLVPNGHAQRPTPNPQPTPAQSQAYRSKPKFTYLRRSFLCVTTTVTIYCTKWFEIKFGQIWDISQFDGWKKVVCFNILKQTIFLSI